MTGEITVKNDPQSQENFSHYSGMSFPPCVTKSLSFFFIEVVTLLMALSTVNEWAGGIGFVRLLRCFAISEFINEKQKNRSVLDVCSRLRGLWFDINTTVTTQDRFTTSRTLRSVYKILFFFFLSEQLKNSQIYCSKTKLREHSF